MSLRDFGFRWRPCDHAAASSNSLCYGGAPDRPGVAVGAFLSVTAGGPFWFAVRTWAVFLGGLSRLFCWIARGSARRDVDPASIKKYNDEWDRAHGYGPTNKGS